MWVKSSVCRKSQLCAKLVAQCPSLHFSPLATQLAVAWGLTAEFRVNRTSGTIDHDKTLVGWDSRLISTRTLWLGNLSSSLNFPRPSVRRFTTTHCTASLLSD